MPPKILEQTPRKSKKILTPHVARGMGLCVSLVNRCGHFIWPTVCFACRTAPCVLKYPKREHFSTYRAFWIVKKRGRRNPLILKSLVLVDWERIQDDKTRCKNAPCGENKQIKSRCESKSRTGADFFCSFGDKICLLRHLGGLHRWVLAPFVGDSGLVKLKCPWRCAF